MSHELLQQILEKVTATDEKVSKLDDRLSKVEDRLSKIDDRLSNVEDRLAKVEDDVSHLTLRQDGMKEELAAIIRNQETSNAKLEALTMDVHHMRGDITAIKEDITALKESERRQDRILETLSMRSLEQETIIPELARVK